MRLNSMKQKPSTEFEGLKVGSRVFKHHNHILMDNDKLSEQSNSFLLIDGPNFKNKAKDYLLIDNAPNRENSAAKKPPRHNLSIGKSQLQKQKSRVTSQL